MTKICSDNAPLIGRRMFIIAGAMVAASMSTTGSARKPCDRTRVLFVCQFGTARSPTAREVMKRRLKSRGVSVDVFSRGVTPEDHLSAELHDKLIAMGINRNAEAVQSLGAGDVASADIVIILNKLSVPIVHRDMRDWSDLPSMSEDFGRSMTDLERRIEALVDEILHRRS